jgi:RNA polymerase sigma-70 factor (ECF subfamily)
VQRATHAKHDPHRLPESYTLGVLLYANRIHPPTQETVWANLVRSIAAGDQLALHSLYELTHRIVFTLIMRIVKNRETAEELTLDVFHDVWRKAGAYDPANGSVVGWVMNQARSRSIDRLRYEQRKKRVQTDPDNSQDTRAVDDPQTALQFDEQIRRVRRALEILSLDERQAIETAFFSEMTYQEVAARLNQPLGTIKSRIRSALNKLRGALVESAESI